MRSVEELISCKINRDDMTDEEHLNFVNYWFDTYEKGGFCTTFASPFYMGYITNYIGKPFTVLGRLTTNDCDLETLPMWRIEFEDSYQDDAFPEEICKLEVEKYVQNSI